MPNTIILKGDPLRKERLANAVVTPGDLLEITSNDRVARHSTAGGVAAPRFAIEEDIVGDEIKDNYASGDRVQLVVGRSGDEILALLASGQNVAMGAALESTGSAGGAGTLRAGTTASGLVAYAAEDKNNASGDSAGPHDGATRFRVEVA